jgi:LysM repeat protein
MKYSFTPLKGLCFVLITLMLLPQSIALANTPVYKLGDRVLTLGTWGADVFELQLILIKSGYEITADGLYGRKTQSAVMAHQIANGLDPDGIVGPKTLETLQVREKTLEYIVQPGDSLWVLAKRFDTTMDKIFSINNLKSTVLKIGQKLLIPAPPTYLVQPGDTLSEIAKHFQCTVKELMEINGLFDPNLIRAGQELRLPRNG